MKIKKYVKDNNSAISVDFDSFTFSGGEEHVRLLDKPANNLESITIETNLTSAAAFMQLCMATDAAKRLYGSNIQYCLEIPYFPYARQDRVCVEGEALSAAVMAKLINSLSFSKVTIWDAHSDVSPALIDNVNNVPQFEIIQQCTVLADGIRSGDLTLVAPDAGAAKKTLSVAKYFNAKHSPIQAEKIRNVATGEITKTVVNNVIPGNDVLIIDDICDGGRTFIELAKALKAQGAGRISLYVTHGIFSKGLEVFEGLIDTIYTTDSFNCVDRFANTTVQPTLVVINA